MPPVLFQHIADASAVRLQTFMPRFPSPLPFERVESGTWRLEVDLPSDARIEYRIEVVHNGATTSVLDASSRETATNPFGTNSVWTGPDYPIADWLGEAAPRGSILEIRVAGTALGGRRSHHVYTPAGSKPSDPLPVVLFHDGSDTFRHADLARCLDVLIHRRSIPPIRAVGLDPRDRATEYTANPAHAGHVVEEALPHFARRFRTVAPVLIAGASLGAVAAWHTAWSHPDVFDGLLLQSGTFALTPHRLLTGGMYESVNRFARRAMAEPPSDRWRVYQSCGRYESLIDWNRRVGRYFDTGEAAARFTESWTGHDWGAWRDGFGPALEFLIGSPHRDHPESRSVGLSGPGPGTRVDRD